MEAREQGRISTRLMLIYIIRQDAEYDTAGDTRVARALIFGLAEERGSPRRIQPASRQDHEQPVLANLFL